MSFCVVVPEILLPKKNIDYSRWAVVACDQFTSEKEYWEKLKNYTGDSVSALNIILPEAYLKADNTERIAKINQNMNKYLKQGIFEKYSDCFIYVERSTPYKAKRRGLIAAVDLEAYSYNDSDKALIRATEGTVLSRIPPRVQIRQDAPIELPHIMVLLDDRECGVIEPLEGRKKESEKLYDFELNMGGGHISGYRITDTKSVLKNLQNLLRPKLLAEKYGTIEKLLLAVGDGNHSLASAKACWDNIKGGLSHKEKENHPARFALVEIVNIHDEGLEFEPIHRAVFGVDNEKFIKQLKAFSLQFNEYAGSIINPDGLKEPLRLPVNAAEAVEKTQAFIDAFISENGGSVDYIHGEESVKNVCLKEHAAGLLLPPLKKEDLFAFLIKKGSLPRKTFSMGEAVEKRYYLEARKIQP